MKSRFSVLGHPIHPMLVALPVALFLWTFASDIVYLATSKNELWYQISFYTGIAAWATALAAALPGFGDYFTLKMPEKTRIVATSHMLLNLSVVALYFVAFLLQWDYGALTGGKLAAVVVLHAIGCGLVSISGWLGGELVYLHHVGMVPEGAQEQVSEEGRRGGVFGVRPR